MSNQPTRHRVANMHAVLCPYCKQVVSVNKAGVIRSHLLEPGRQCRGAKTKAEYLPRIRNLDQ